MALNTVCSAVSDGGSNGAGVRAEAGRAEKHHAPASTERLTSFFSALLGVVGAGRRQADDVVRLVVPARIARDLFDHRVDVRVLLRLQERGRLLRHAVAEELLQLLAAKVGELLLRVAVRLALLCDQRAR